VRDIVDPKEEPTREDTETAIRAILEQELGKPPTDELVSKIMDHVDAYAQDQRSKGLEEGTLGEDL
jgi:hypothetical protein